MLDYNLAEGDAIDLSPVLEAVFRQGQQAADLVQIKADAGGQFATVQVDADGTANGSNFVVLAQLNAAHAGDVINVTLDHAQQAQQIQVT